MRCILKERFYSELGQPYDLVIYLKSVSNILKQQLLGNKINQSDAYGVHSGYEVDNQVLKVSLLRFYHRFNFLVTIGDDTSLVTIDRFLQASLLNLAHA